VVEAFSSLCRELDAVPQDLPQSANTKIFLNTGCLEKSFTTSKAYVNLFRGHAQCLKSHNEAKHTEFYLG
jgi:hypothetical protein